MSENIFVKISFFLLCIVYKTNKDILTFCDIQIEKRKNQNSKYPIDMYNVDIDIIMISNKVHFGKKNFKQFIGYSDKEITRPLSIVFPRISGYEKSFIDCKYMLFVIKNEDLLNELNIIQIKVSKLTKKEFENDLVYENKYIETKIKTYGKKVNRLSQNSSVSRRCSLYLLFCCFD